MKSYKQKLKEFWANEFKPMLRWVGLGLVAGVTWTIFCYIAIKPVFGYSVASQLAAYATLFPIGGFGVFLYKHIHSEWRQLKRKLAEIKKMEQKALDPETYKKS